jgi:hypothetical protein
MIVWITHVKVGHRQTPYKQNAPPVMVGRFAFQDVNIKLNYQYEFPQHHPFKPR